MTDTNAFGVGLVIVQKDLEKVSDGYSAIGTMKYPKELERAVARRRGLSAGGRHHVDDHGALTSAASCHLAVQVAIEERTIRRRASAAAAGS